MNLVGNWGTPGLSVDFSTFETELYWGGSQARNGLLWQGARIAGTTRDAGDTPTTIIRPGLILGRYTANPNQFQDFNSANTDGSGQFAGVIDMSVMTTDFLGNNTDRVIRVATARGPVVARRLLIQGANLVGHADEYLVRRQMVGAQFVFDDDPCGYLAGVNYRTNVQTGTAYTVLPTDNGTFFSNEGAGGNINYTLPAIQKGLQFSFYAEAAGTVTVTAGTANTLVTYNNAAASSVALSTSAKIVGGEFRVRANFDATKWLVEVLLANIAQVVTVA